MTPEQRKEVLTRLSKRFEVCRSSCCWIWNARTSRNGYGRISVLGKERQVHRVMHEFFISAIRRGFVVDHLCRNRSCINPSHIQQVKPRTNTLRGHGPTGLGLGGPPPGGCVVSGRVWSEGGGFATLFHNRVITDYLKMPHWIAWQGNRIDVLVVRGKPRLIAPYGYLVNRGKRRNAVESVI